MLINKIILENYGLYKGIVDFDLTPRVKYNKTRPVILFGGNNGTGKTTLLDAIRLIFYGKSILGNRVSKTDYEYFLRNKIHRSDDALHSHKFARVGAEFQHVHMGNVDDYYVERSWSITSSDKVKEFLIITHNGKAVDNVTDDYWRGVMEEIIPERLSQLFFFDGEKIKAIAEDKSSNRALAESIKILLGLDIVDRLKADLAIYNSREVKKISTVDDGRILSNLENAIKRVEQEIVALERNHASIGSDIAGNENEIKKLEQRLDSEGAVFSCHRSTKKQEKEALAVQINEVEKHIVEECETTFPFALCPSIVSEFKKRIKIEQKAKQKAYSMHELDSVHQKLIDAFTQNNQKYDGVAKIIDNIFLSQKRETVLPENMKIIHDLSNTEEQQLFQWLNDATDRSMPKIKEHGIKLNELTAQLHKVVKNLAKSPGEALLKPIFEELNAYNKELGICLQERKQVEKELSSKRNQYAALQREKMRLEEKYSTEEQARGRLKLVKNVQRALDSYLIKLTEKKIAELRSKVVDCFNHLSRKGDLVSHIEINAKTFQVTLYDHSDNAIPKKQLSAGEKQIFAISMLWGLAKTAKRPLPVIIDTPLGRLDSEHRSNLINNYFPEAAHQVILFSTDTEVDNSLYRELSPNISHCYHLTYGKKQRYTTAKEGYFWKEATNA
jgi:DNA sulfur modification protein DndD